VPPNSEITELVIALVVPLGTDVDMILTELSTELNEYEYETSPHRLSDYLVDLVGPPDLKERKFDERLDTAMTSGDTLRRRWKRGDALALCAISDITATRAQKAADQILPGPGDVGEPLPGYLERHAFVLRSLKTKDEVETLRAVYGPRFVLIAAYAPNDVRTDHVADEIRGSRHNNDRDTWAHQPEALIQRDRDEEITGGQDVLGTFHQADFFIDATNQETTRRYIVRTLEILFGHPFRTPTRDEYAQFAAQGAALRSAELGRQVGAAIATDAGSVIALGTNEVPKYGGGAHWEEDPDEDDHREFRGTRDTNREHQERLADDVATAIKERLTKDIASASGGSEGLSAELERLVDIMRESVIDGPLLGLTEFGRAVHAEMDALLDAARRGVSVAGTTLHTTTFPCHNCARHIIAAGVKRVVYVSPYAKSRAEELHRDAIVSAESGATDRVSFEPFVGVAPRRYLQMFNAAARERAGHTRRKDAAGNVQTFSKRTAMPVMANLGPLHLRPQVASYRQKELLALDHYERKLAEMESSDAGDIKEAQSDTNGGEGGSNG
jgi:cytidine deaminase